MRVAIYARVSTTDQNCEMQLRELREYVKRRGWLNAGEYVDTGWSGGKASRPELDKVMLAARKRQVDCVIVWKLDRWGRGVAHCLQSLQELRSLGVRWIAITQNLDTDESNPMSRLMLTLMAAFAEFEREIMRERVKAGLQAARHQGRVGGRPRKVFARSKVAPLHKAGWSVRAIAAKLGVSTGSVQRELRR
jgi:DNA invertase Pin-like site-specific DNA recombinase